MNRYEKYKDSYLDWIGEIPEHWSLSKIKYLAAKGEDTFQDGDWIESKEIVEDGYYRYITTGNIGEGKYKEQGRSFITQETFEKLECLEIFPDDILISRLNPPIGRSCIIPDIGYRIVTSVDNVVLRPNESFDKRFIVYLTNSAHYYEYTGLIARGATMARISRSLLGLVEVAFPSKEEQASIANYLDEKTSQIDKLITDKQKLIELLKEERTAIINNAVSGEGKNWARVKLKYVTEVNSETLSEKGNDDLEIEYIDISSVNENGRINNTSTFDFSEAPSRARRIVREGDTIISTVRTYLKAIAFIDNPKENLICSTGFAVIRPTEKLNKMFLFYLCRSQKFIDIITSLSKGVSYPAIDSEDLKNIEIAFPDLQEQVEIIEILQTEHQRIDNAVSVIEKEVELMQEYRTALISEVVTGKVKVV